MAFFSPCNSMSSIFFYSLPVKISQVWVTSEVLNHPTYCSLKGLALFSCCSVLTPCCRWLWGRVWSRLLLNRRMGSHLVRKRSFENVTLSLFSSSKGLSIWKWTSQMGCNYQSAVVQLLCQTACWYSFLLYFGQNPWTSWLNLPVVTCLCSHCKELSRTWFVCDRTEFLLPSRTPPDRSFEYIKHLMT